MNPIRLVVSAALVTALGTGGAAAQTLGFGGKVGAVFSTVKFDGDDSLNVAGKAGVVGGGFATLRLASKLIIEADVFYSVRKSEFEGTVVDTMTYVDVPILLRLGIINREAWQLHALVGGAVSFLQKGEEAVGGFEADITDTLESVETSVIGGAEVTLWRRWLIDFRYIYGLSDIYAAPRFSAKTRTFVIMGGYRVR